MTNYAKYEVVLESKANPDYLYQGSLGRVRQELTKNIHKKKVSVITLADAKKLCLRFIADNELGGGNWTGGQVFKFSTKTQVAYISYNGRVWEGKMGSGKEITKLNQ